MASTNKIKIVFLALFVGGGLFWTMSPRTDAVSSAPLDDEPNNVSSAVIQDDYVGSEACQACHEDQFKEFAGTKHAKLKEVAAWKNKPQGCESCHGPGKKHVEDATVPGSIISFKKMNPKEASETCLACHAGKESHNNYRRGEHWRNNVGCNTCHAVHGPPPGNLKVSSSHLIGEAAKQRPNQSETAMLRQSEPALCIACHNEVKAQFSKPFRHKVMEGTMRCSDCHNAHGGFEGKQTKLAVGVDASCIKCHSNKQGPFVFEHAPSKVEGCAICHIPHGSANPKMLKRPQVRQMCIECHTGISEELPGQLPNRHNQARVRETQCTVCHAAIHGSNSSRLLFR